MTHIDVFKLSIPRFVLRLQLGRAGLAGPRFSLRVLRTSRGRSQSFGGVHVCCLPENYVGTVISCI